MLNSPLTKKMLQACLLWLILTTYYGQLAHATAGIDLFETSETAEENIHPRDVVSWQTFPAQLTEHGNLVIRANLLTTRGFGLYSDRVHFKTDWGLILESVTPPDTEQKHDPVSDKKVPVYTQGDFELTFAVPSAATARKLKSLNLSITYTSCSEGICLFPYTESLHVEVLPNPKAEFSSSSQPFASTSSMADSLLHEFESEEKAKRISLWLLFMVALAGLLTNLTPCVFPMIPITIRLLGKNSKNHWISGIVYSLGILATYSGLGFFAVLSGSMFAGFMANPMIQAALGIMMAVLGLSMIYGKGFDQLQQIGYNLGNHSKGLSQIFLMGLGAGFIASPCTGPVLASLLAFASTSQNPKQGILLISIYSAGFAAPYALLGALSGHLSRLQVSPNVQIAAKFIFASAMFALSFYYLRLPMVTLHHALQPHYEIIAIVSMLGGLSVFAFRPEKSSVQLLSSLLVGGSLFAGSQILTTGKTQLPDSSHQALKWYYDEEEATAVARKKNAPMLIDIWAEWCEACKEMDRTTFVDPSLTGFLKNKEWVLLKIDMTTSNTYTDSVEERYSLIGMPSLIVISNPHQPENYHRITGYRSGNALLNELTSKALEPNK